MKKQLLILMSSVLFGTSCLAQNLVSNLVFNGSFELPKDGKKHLFITERAGWFSDDATENHNGTEYSTNMSGNFYWFNVNIAGTIYQPIDKITTDSASYKVSYSYLTVYNADLNNDTIYSVVYFSHYTPGTSIKNRQLIDSIATDVTLVPGNSLITATFNLPANVNYAGDSLVVEFATRVVDHHAVNTNTWAGADSIVVKKIITAQLPVVNGGFELPDDGQKHLFITERTGWFCDDATSNQNGTEHSTNMEGNFYWFNVNTAGTIYQPIDKITTDSALYKVSYSYGTVWNADAGNDTIYSVVYFSHYTPGTSIKNRQLIDSLITDVTLATWESLVTVSFKLPANVSYVGDSLVVEFATRVVDHHALNTNTWAGADSIVVFKTGIYSFPEELDVTKPSVVTNLSIEKRNSQVLLSWDAATDNIGVEKYVILVNSASVDTIEAKATGNSCIINDITNGSYIFSVIAIDIAGNKSDTVSKSETFTGVKNAGTVTLSIYPNPASSYISLNIKAKVKMEIFNAAGQMILIKYVNGNEKVNISALKNGIYNVKIIGANTVSVLKLVKK